MIFKHAEGSRLAYRMGFSWSLFLQGVVEQKINPKQPEKDDFISSNFQWPEEPLKDQKGKTYTCEDRR